jgi:hypothetical protein
MTPGTSADTPHAPPDPSTEEVPFLSDPTGQKHYLDEATTIGRAIENDIVITSRRVSREHARVRREGWRRMLEDQDSTNGTYLNGELVRAPVELRDGDRIKIGDVVFVFHDPDITYRDSPIPALEVDVAAGVVRVDREPVSLSPKEFALLVCLHDHCGEVCSKDDIARAVWPEYEDDVYDYQVENLVRRLRTKIEPDPTDPQMIQTVRGLGYKLVARV